MNKYFLKSACILLALAGLISCGDDHTATAPVEAAPVIETFQLKKEKLSSELRLPAELLSFQQVDIYAKVSSYVKTLKVDIGSRVTAGQLLIVLEAPEISSQLAGAESRLQSQEAIYMASKSTYNRLVETAKIAGAVSKNDIDQAEAKKNSDFAQFKAAQSAYKEISIMRSYLEIRAPFSGVVSARNVNLGAYVGPAGKGSDLPLFTIQEQTKLRLAVAVPELYAGYLHIGDKMEFSVKSLPGRLFNANIQRMSGALDLKLRSERIEMDVENANRTLLPGMVAEVLLSLTAQDSSFVVPKTAVVNSAEGVFIVRVVNNKMERVSVQKGREIEDRVELFGDISVNDELVTFASEEMRNGMLLKK